MCHIDLLVKAIKDVDVNAFAHFDNRGVEILNERSFAYELYRVWYSLNKKNKTGLVINAEITKRIEDKFKKKTEELFKEKTERFLPDMVLHQSQWDSAAQELICEIKIFNNLTKESLLKDLKKLVAYTTPACVLYHPFKEAVFILVNCTKKLLTEKFTLEEIEELKNSPITCLFVNINIRENISVERCSINEVFEHNLK